MMGTSRVSGYAIQSGDTPITGNYENVLIDVLIELDYTNDEMRVKTYDQTGALIRADSARDISGLTPSGTDNYAPFTVNSEVAIFDSLRLFTGIKTIAQCSDQSYSTDLYLEYLSLFSGLDSSGSGEDLTPSNVTDDDKVWSYMNSMLPNRGADLYYSATFADDYQKLLIPKDASGASVIPNRTAGYGLADSRIVFPHTSGGVCSVHDTMLDFSVAFMDRSDTDIWSDDARAGYYDAANPSRWHYDELNQRNFYEWLNTAYKGYLYVKFSSGSVEKNDRKYLEELFIYTTQKTSSSDLIVLTYTGDSKTVITTTAGEKLYDADDFAIIGYLQMRKGALVIRIDDGDQSVYDSWRNWMSTRNLTPIMGIHPNIMGTTGAYEFMTWGDALTLVNTDGWQLACHNADDVDLNQTAYCELEDLEDQMKDGRTDIIAQGVTCKHYIANRHSSEHPGVDYYAKEYGFRTMIAWGDYAIENVNGTNPINLDPYRVCAMATDLAGDYYFDDADNTQEIANFKAQLDLALSDRRLAIGFFHTWDTDVAAAWAEIVTYCDTIELDILTMDEAMTRVRYMREGYLLSPAGDFVLAPNGKPIPIP